MKLITDIDKKDCYEVVDGQNHYLVPFDYGCYAYKDIQKSEEERIRGISDWKQFCSECCVVKMIVPVPWLKVIGTRGKAIKETIPNLVREHMVLCDPFCVVTSSGEYLVVSTHSDCIKEPSILGLGEYNGFRYRLDGALTNYSFTGDSHSHVMVWSSFKEPILKPISITHKVEKYF